MYHCLILSVSNFNPGRPAGAHRIATHLRQQGWDAEVVDFADFWTLEQLIELSKQRITQNTKFIGLSYVFNRGGSIELMNSYTCWVKQTYPNIHIISGGQVEPLFMKYTDYHINGYAELALDALLSYLYSNGTRPPFSVMSFNEVGNRVKVLDANKQVNYHAFPWKGPLIKYEARDYIMPNEWGQTELARGCRFKCKFCSLPALGLKGDYTRDAEDFREHLLHAYDNWGMENYILSDETVNDSVEKLKKFADVVESLPWKPYMVGMMRADLMISQEQQRHEMLRMGLLGHFYGIESFHPEAAKAVGKGMHPDKVKAGLLECKDFFKSHVGRRFRSSTYFIGGLQYETKESLDETHAWLKKNWADQEYGAAELEIQNVETSKIYKVSDLSKDYMNRGFQQMTDDEFKAACDREGVSHDFINSERDIHKGMFWKNEQMDIVYAAKWARSLSKDFILAKKNLKKVQSRYLQWNYTKSDGTLLNVDERIALTEDTKEPYLKNFKEIFVPAYINKKLS